MVTTRLVFDHRGRTPASKEGPVEVRIIVDGKPYYVNTGVKVLSSQWRDGEVVKRDDRNLLNERLQIIAQKAAAEINECIRQGVPVNVAEIRREIYSLQAGKQGSEFLDWFEAQIPYLPVAEGTKKRYLFTLAALKEYDVIKRWKDLTQQNIYLMDAWLRKRTRSVRGEDGKSRMGPIADAGVYNYHKTLKAMLGRAVRLGILDSNPYEKMKGEFKKGKVKVLEYLTEDEIKAFESLRPMPNTNAAMAHDLFIFQLYTGFDYSTAMAFRIEDYRFVNGRWIGGASRVKTDVPFVTQLLPQAVDVLERYGWKPPKLTDWTYNRYLHFFEKALGLNKHLHSHLARHTFATRALAAGVKIENLSKMMGHTNIVQTQVYAKVLAKSVHEDFDMLRKKLEREKEE